MWGLLAVFLVTAMITVYLTFVTARIIAGRTVPVESVPLGAPEAASSVSLLSLLDGDTMLQGEDGLKPEPWDGENRVTVLLMGLDFRDWEDDGPSRSDTLMLLTMDAATNTAGILSLPRDLWVNIPGYGYGKINTAYYLGDAYNEPGGGPGLAVRTVEEFLGVPINYYAQIDFSAFERFIDELGGIEVEVPQDILVDPIGPGNTVFLEAGPQTLDGATALAYARNRDTAGSDFDRAARQQQVIMAIRKRILSLDMLPTLIKNAPQLYDQLASGVHSNLTLKEIVQLAFSASQVPAENINRRVISPEHVTFTYSPEGMDILVPDTDAVRQLRDEVFAKTSSVAPAGATEGVTGGPIEMMEAEQAAISVLNATMVPGLASETTMYLLDEGLNVVHTGNATELTSITTIIDYTGMPYTVQYLVNLFNIPESNIYSRYSPNSEVDITVLLGDDWASNNSLP
jgi:LCP family protein required for cell wall assembly